MKYRREIDGLRALAVIPVVMFHAGFSGFSGGFVGVDIFFVISGYLITSIIHQDLSQQRFSLISFYERRARRILPALFFVMAACTPFAWAWMVPSELHNFGKSLVAVGFFASNILFYNQSGYFEPDAEKNVLLHTWSLAVEEQFYLFFPIFLACLWPLGRRRVFMAVAGITIASFALSEIGWRTDASANFFLAPTRAWELLVGSLCAFLRINWESEGNEAGAAIGLALIITSIAYYDEHTPFPSLYTLAPVGGAALIILWASPKTGLGRVLASGPLVGIGLISYSAYLWHQPLLAFARIRTVFEPSAWLMAALCLASFCLAWLSWRFIEMPFRERAGRPVLQGKSVFAFSAIGTAILVVYGLYVHFERGLPNRPVAALEQPLIDPERKRQESYHLLRDDGLESQRVLYFLNREPGARALVLGDSHSKDVFNAFALNQKAYPDVAFLRRDLEINCSKYPQPDYFRCPETFIAENGALFEAATHVVLSARWHEIAGALGLIAAYIEHFADRGKVVIVMSNTVEYTPEPPQLMRSIAQEINYGPGRRFPKRMADEMFYERRAREVGLFNRQLSNLVKGAQGGLYYDKSSLICDDVRRTCESITTDGEAIYYDYGHWTLEGARYLGKRMIAEGWSELLKIE